MAGPEGGGREKALDLKWQGQGTGPERRVGPKKGGGELGGVMTDQVETISRHQTLALVKLNNSWDRRGKEAKPTTEIPTKRGSI